MCMKVSGKAARLSMMQEAAAAAEARQKEEERQARLKKGVDSINALFDPKPVMGERDATYDWSKFNPSASYSGSWGSRSITPTVENFGLPEGYKYQNGGVYDPTGKLLGSGYDRESLQKGIGNFAYKEKFDTGQKAGGFDDSFYGDFRQKFLDYYNPDIEKQYGKARDDLNFAHARAGTLNSSMAGQNLADLVYQNDINRAQIANKADAATAGLRQNVGSQKAALISQLYSTENPDIAANTALNSVRTLKESTPDLNPLGDIFKLAAIGGGSFMNSYNDPYARMGSPWATAGSGRNIN